MPLRTRITDLLQIRYPIIQAGMSWASSDAELPAAVSAAGGLGVIAAGPMYPEDLRQAIQGVRARTSAPFAVNVALYNKRAAEHLEVIFDEKVPIIVASQGSPRAHLARARAAGITWVHVTANPIHAVKAEAAGVDAVVAVGFEAGGHPGPDEIGTAALVRATVKAVKVPVLAAGGIADGAGIAAMLCLGAEGVQLGTRFLLTPEANLHVAYKEAVLRAPLHGTTLVGRGRSPIRMLRNAFAEAYGEAERIGSNADLDTLFASRSLKQAALEGDVEQGKVEAGQSAGLIDSLAPAAEVVERLVDETLQALTRSARLLD